MRPIAAITFHGVVGVLLLAMRAFAEDAGAVIAAFNDPEAECRYVKTLCAEALAVRKPYDEKYKVAYELSEHAHKVAKSKDAGPNSLVNMYNSSKAAENAQREFYKARDQWIGPHNNLVDALKVLAAKRGDVPACVPPDCVAETAKKN